MGAGAINLGSAKLTARERNVLELLMRGASNKEIALELACSVKTVEFHVSNLLQKCGAATRLELVARALLGSNSPAT